MASIPKKVADRLIAGIKQFQPVLTSAKQRDVGEADTVTIVKDMLAAVFGYDKYSEVTSEFSIRGTYCDLATKIDGVVQTLIEVKAVGYDLKEAHTKQAIEVRCQPRRGLGTPHQRCLLACLPCPLREAHRPGTRNYLDFCNLKSTPMSEISKCCTCGARKDGSAPS